MVGPAWGSAPLSLQHQPSTGSSAAHTDTPGDTPTANLLGPGPWRTSSGWGDAPDLLLPDPHNRSPRNTSGSSHGSGSAGNHLADGGPPAPPRRQMSWHQRELAVRQVCHPSSSMQHSDVRCPDMYLLELIAYPACASCRRSMRRSSDGARKPALWRRHISAAVHRQQGHCQREQCQHQHG